MALLGYWPPLAHLTLVAACAATAWWRFETAPAAPSRAAAGADLVAVSSAMAAGEAGPGARDWRGDVEAVAARALFRPGRLARADGEPAAPARSDPPASAAPATLRMVGYIRQGARRLAILQTVEDGQSHIVQEGDELAGATIRQIGPRAVVVESAGQPITVQLYPD